MISTRKNSESIGFDITIDEKTFVIEFGRSYLLSNTKDDVLAQVKEKLSANKVGRKKYFKILNQLNLTISDYLRDK